MTIKIPVRLHGVKLSNKKHTASRKKAGMRLNNFVNRTDLCNIYSTKIKEKTLSPTL